MWDWHQVCLENTALKTKFKELLKLRMMKRYQVFLTKWSVKTPLFALKLQKTVAGNCCW